MSNHTIENTETTINIKRRGRPKGSGAPNVIEVSLEDLLHKADTHNLQSVFVSRTWFNKLGLVKTINVDKVENTENKIEFTVS